MLSIIAHGLAKVRSSPSETWTRAYDETPGPLFVCFDAMEAPATEAACKAAYDVMDAIVHDH